MNYNRKFEEIINTLSKRPRLLLHSCCAPCSSYCLIRLLPHFDVTCFFYNPNITDRAEYDRRLAEMYKLTEALEREEMLCAKDGPCGSITIIEGDYESGEFTGAVEEKGLTKEPEGGERCSLCFTLRLKKTYEMACAEGFDYFATTLTISPHKNAQLINSIGESVAGKPGASGDTPLWLPADFKKNDGYRHSIELSKKYGLYRQNYCGCEYSLNEMAVQT